MNRHHGFTLIELMVTLAVMSIMAAFALPAMNHFVDNQRVSSTVSNYSNALTFARNEAIRQNVPTVVCPASISVAGQLSGCMPNVDNGFSNWSEGVFVFADVDKNRNYAAATDRSIRTVQSPNPSDGSAAKVTISITAEPIGGGAALSDFRVQFLPNGQAAVLVPQGTAFVADNPAATPATHYIRIQAASGGKAAVSLIDPSGQLVRCGVLTKKNNAGGDRVAALCATKTEEKKS